MNEGEFSQLQHTKIVAGQHELASAMRTLIRRTAPRISDSVKDLADEFFLEPALFTFFARSERDPILGLPQIIFGKVPAEARPDAIEVYSDHRGRIYLPGIGTLLTDRRCSTLALAWDRRDGIMSLLEDQRPVSFVLEPPTYLSGTSIELVRYGDPTLRTRFFDTSLAPVEVELDGRGDRHRRHLERALELLREYCPNYTRELLRVTRRIAVFSGENINSFATLNAHGVAFFNARDAHDEVYFIDELVHQCGHIIFNAMTTRRRDFLAMDPDLALSAILPRETSNRKLYDTFHGLYTEDVMSEYLRNFDERGVFYGRQKQELYGRLCFITQKFRIDLRNMSGPDIFTPLGQIFYQRWKSRFEALVRARPELLETKLGRQPYNFDFEIFASASAA